MGEGAFEFKNYQTGDVDSFDLGAGDSTTVVRDGYTARVILGDDAVFRYYWIEDDPGLDAPWPGDGRTISMRPGTADKPHRTLTRYEQEPTDAGCGANLTYRVFTYIQPD